MKMKKIFYKEDKMMKIEGKLHSENRDVPLISLDTKIIGDFLMDLKDFIVKNEKAKIQLLEFNN